MYLVNDSEPCVQCRPFLQELATLQSKLNDQATEIQRLRTKARGIMWLRRLF